MAAEMNLTDIGVSKSFAALNSYFTPETRSETGSNIAQLVLFAERILKSGYKQIAAESIQLFLSLRPPVNQFYIRALLCQAEIAAPRNVAEEPQLVESLASIVKAVNIAKKSECYHFLVFNASVLLWSIVRPFQHTGFQRAYASQLQTVLKVVEEIREKDYAWRLELMRGLLLAQTDNGNREEAIKTGTAAIYLARKHVPDQVIPTYKLMVLNGLGDAKLVEKELKSFPEFSFFTKLWKLKNITTNRQQSRRSSSAGAGAAAGDGDSSGAGSDVESRLAKLLTAMTKGESREGRRAVTTKMGPLAPDVGTPIILELGQLAIEQGYSQVAADSLSAISQQYLSHPDHLIQYRLLSAYVSVGSTDITHYSKSTVEVRVKVVKRCEECLAASVRNDSIDMIEHCSIVLWNLALPLLQPTLRHHLYRSLTAVSKALETIDSLQIQLRILVHLELSRICADQDQMSPAMEHLQKAELLDCNSMYHSQLGQLEQQFSLKAQLYSTPVGSVEKAAQLIEQMKNTTSKTDGVAGVRSLLVKVAQLLAPSYVDITTLPGGEDKPVTHDPEFRLNDLAKKAQVYSHCKQSVVKHSESVGKEKEEERMVVWASLVKAARKAGVWDVAQLGAMMCLLYDDNRWTYSPIVTPKGSSYKIIDPKAGKRSGGGIQSRSQSRAKLIVGTEKTLLRTLAEIHCLYGECLVHSLQLEGLLLGQSASPSSARLDSDACTGDQWSAYCKWIASLTDNAQKSFLRAADIGCMLQEPWLVSNAAVYLWNHHLTTLQQNRQNELVDVFRPLLKRVMKVALKNEQTLICQLATALATGLVERWMPKSTNVLSLKSSIKKRGSKSGSSGLSPKGKGKKGDGNSGGLIPSEAMPDLKEAMEVCEYSMGQLMGVPLPIKQLLLGVWVQSRQLLQQSVATTSLPSETAADPHIGHCRAIVAVELYRKMSNRIFDFPNCPSIREVFEMVTKCEWDSEVLLKADLYTHLANAALNNQEYKLVTSCCEQVLSLADKIELFKKEQHKDKMKGYTLLSQAACLQGQGCGAESAGNIASVKNALYCFTTSAQFACKVLSYSHAIQACRHAWNTCQSLLVNPLDREALQQPLMDIIKCLVKLIGRGGKAEDIPEVLSKADIELMGGVYRVVFQVYVDKECWKDGLTGLENALWMAPKPLHRGLAKQKIVFKSRLGKNVEGDMVRFQEDPEEVRSQLWYSAASNATNSSEQQRAYLKAIETLQSSEFSWRKMEYISEYALWLHSTGYPTSDGLDHLEWAIELLLSASRGEEESSSLDSLSLVHQIEMLMRLNVTMADMLGGRSPKHRTYCLQALGACILLWKRIYSNTGDQKGKTQLLMPGTVDQWTVFTLPAELKIILSSPSDDKSLFSSATVTKPLVTLHYLELLTEGLFTHNLHPLVYPVLHLQLVIAECIVDSEVLTQLVHLRLARLCQDLGHESSSAKHSAAAGSVFPLPSDIAKSRSKLELHKSKQAALQAELGRQSKGTIASSSSNTGKQQQSSSHESAGELCLRRLWCDQAKILIHQGMYQSASNLLQQTRTASEVYGDTSTLLECLIQMAHLSLLERRPNDAVNLLLKTNELPCNPEQCVRIVDLFVQAQSSSDAAVGLQQEAMKALDTALQQRANEALTLQYARTTIKAKCVFDQQDMATNLTECVKTLTDIGCHCDAAHWLQTLADHYSKQYFDAPVHTETHKEYILKAIESCRHAVRILQEEYEQVVQLCQPTESMTLPVQRKLVCAQVQLADLLVILMSEAEEEEQAERDRRQGLSSVDKYIDNFPRDISMVQNQWKQTSQVATEEALGLLTTGFNLSRNSSELRAQCLCSIGRCLHLTASQHPLEKGLQWEDDLLQLLREQEMEREKEREQQEMEEGKERERSAAALTLQSTRSLISAATIREEDSGGEDTQRLGLLSQAVSALGQAITTGLHAKKMAIVKRSSLIIADLVGCFDPATAVSYLALFQSCIASQQLYSVLTSALSDPLSCELAGLMQQENHLNTNKLSIAYSACESTLEKKFEAWRRLKVDEDHLELIKNFNSDFRFIILQHSPDRATLYSGYLMPPQPTPPAKKGQISQQSVNQPVISSASVSESELSALVALAKEYRERCANSQCTVRQQVQDELQAQLEAIVTGLNSYLSTVIKPVADALKREDTGKQLTIVLLADTDLLSLPLESLPILQAENVHCVARDFSLQMSYHRLCKLKQGEDEEEGSKKKASDKYVPQASSLQLNNNLFKYVEDPRNELSLSTDSCVRTVIQTFPKVTAKWTGLSGMDHIISGGEWSPLLQSCAGLVLQCSERFLAHYPPQWLAAINVTDCGLAMVLDRMSTLGSYRLQSKLDYNKSATRLYLESPLSTAMLLSLTGVGSVFMKQWYSSVENTTTTMKSTLEGLLSSPSTVGEVYWSQVKKAAAPKPAEPDKPSNDDELASTPETAPQTTAPGHGPEARAMYNFVLYGLPHLTVIANS